MRSIVGPLTKLLAFMLVTVLATSLLALTIANVDLRSANDYTARFTDVTSLNPGDDVRIAGVRVGQVDKISVVDRRLAEVSFSVDGGKKLPASVTATIKYRNLVGQRYVSLEQGAAGGDANAVLPVGGTIPLDRTKPALDLTVLFNGFKPLFQALSPDDVNKLSYEIIQVLQGEGGTIDSLLAHTASLTTTIAGKDQVIGQVIDNLNSVLDTVNSRGDQLSTLIVQLQQLVSGFAADRKPIGDSISALGDLATSTAGLLDQGRQPLKEDIAGLGALSKNLGDSSELLDHFLKFLPGKVEAIGRTGSYGSFFNVFLCKASGTIAVPPVIPPVTLPVLPVTQQRCKA
ncbi:MCE family protein [Kutzneria viridogrisea]|uniref:Phospholipid/cholesterol/gamma-HCH transport system substrate-binding protein n=1 Tax=Kutzneria viridogrisea TaxID=47990 RepID=A0ABR6BY78_9PSEU|nr:phospholipid/cholesterol/gamma-HCH transport system substrate-binding protein [Kutzneria viridogrisea]